MKPWERALLFVCGLVSGFAIIAIARFSDVASAKAFTVPVVQPSGADFDWRRVPNARAVRIPDGPPPAIEVRVGTKVEGRVAWPAGRSTDGSGESVVTAYRLDSGPGSTGFAFAQGDGFSGTSAMMRFGGAPTDLRLRVEDFRDFGPPFEFVWSHVQGTVDLTSWPLEPGVSIVAFDLTGRLEGEPRTLRSAFVVPK